MIAVARFTHPPSSPANFRDHKEPLAKLSEFEGAAGKNKKTKECFLGEEV